MSIEFDISELSVNDQNEIKKFDEFLMLLDTRMPKDELTITKEERAIIVDQCYNEVYGKDKIVDGDSE